MVTYLLKKSYQLKNLQEVDYKHLWGNHGIFTTMWVFGKPPKILFFENHIGNLIKSLKIYGIKKKFLKKDIIKIINKNLEKKRKYNHLIRVALNKRMISISLRKKLNSKLNFNLKLVKLKREKPQYKNLKYKKILKHLVNMDNSKSDIGLVCKNQIFESGTSNLLFVKNDKFFVPKKNYYEGHTYKYLKTRINRIIKKDININELKIFDEILLVGSGKGIASVKTIKQINWKRKNLNQYKILLRHYRSAIKNCNLYKF